MTIEAAADIRARLMQLDAEYWHRVDHPGGQEVAELYADDGRMVFTAFRLQGPEAIRKFFTGRNSTVPPRVTRHVSSNFRCEPLGSGDMRVHSIVTVYAGLGEPPLATGLPTSVLDFTDICTLQGGCWRYRERSGTAIFIGPGAASFLVAQLQADHPLRASK